MGNQAKIDSLMHYTDLMKKRKGLLDDYEYFKHKLSSISNNRLSGMHRAKGLPNDRIENNILRLDKFKELIQDNLEELIKSWIAIELMVSQLHNSTHRRLLRLRYIHCMKFDKISKLTGYNVSYVYQLHNEALKLINSQTLPETI